MEDPRIFTAFRGEADLLPTTAKDFGGIEHCARFSSSASLQLLSIGLYGRKLTGPEYAFRHLPGPRDADGRVLERNEPTVNPKWAMLVVEIRESRYFNPRKTSSELRTFLPRMMVEINVTNQTQNNIFLVRLPYPVPIPAHVIFDIAFQLYGIDEPLKFHCIGQQENMPKDIFPAGCNVVISVHQSSQQCAGFQFSLTENNWNGIPPQLPTRNGFVPDVVPGQSQVVKNKKANKRMNKEKAMKYFSLFLSFF